LLGSFHEHARCRESRKTGISSLNSGTCFLQTLNLDLPYEIECLFIHTNDVSQ
jgi:hypothetical protein